MIVEYLRYTIPEERADAFEAAYATAAASLHGSPHCLGYELARCGEERRATSCGSSGTPQRATSRASAARRRSGRSWPR